MEEDRNEILNFLACITARKGERDKERNERERERESCPRQINKIYLFLVNCLLQKLAVAKIGIRFDGGTTISF